MIVSKLVRVFFLLLAIFLGFSLVKLLLFTFVPSLHMFLPPCLPEDFFLTFLYSMADELITAYPTILLCSVVLTFSFWLKDSELTKEMTSGHHATSRILVLVSILLVTVAVGFAILTLFAQPWIQGSLSDARYKFQLTQALEGSYLKLKENDAAPGSEQEKVQQEKKLNILHRLSTLRPSQRTYSKNEQFDYEFEIQILNSHLQLEEFFLLRRLPGVEKEPLITNRTVADLLDIAQEKAKAKDPDYYSINLLAYQSFVRLTNTEIVEPVQKKQLSIAQSLIDQSWTAIYNKTLSNDERLKASYFFRKGKSLGDFQFQNFLEAYYGFLELHKENPSDDEVSRHLALSKEKLNHQILFSQDMDVLFVAPGFQNIVYKNPDRDKEKMGQQEIIRIRKLLDTPEGIFVSGFELLRFNKEGKILLHWQAPYGKWVDQAIDFRVWNIDTPTNSFPRVLVETPGNSFMEPGAIEPPLFKMRLSCKELESLVAPHLLPRSTETSLLMFQGNSIISLGASPIPLQTEFLNRIIGPFGFLVLLFGTFYFSWLLRAQNFGKKTPPIWRLLIVLLPPVAFFLLEAMGWGSQLIIAGLLLILDISLVCLIAIGLCALLLGIFLSLSWFLLKKNWD